AAQTSSPAVSEICQEQIAGVFRAAQQWTSGSKDRIEREGCVENLCGRVVISGVQGEPGQWPPMQLELGAVGDRFVDVLVLADEIRRIDDGEINLISEQVVVISRCDGILAAQQRLLHSCLKGAIFLSL